jgi:hypothetical protein
MESRMDVINTLIEMRGYKRYLEIGCQSNLCFDLVFAETKVGVDPKRGGTHRMTSDRFFRSNHEQFDIIFIDGDHHHEQVFKDVVNAMIRLAPGGAIVMHDCLPPDAEHESRSRCGTAWRVFAEMRSKKNVDSITADLDYGVGIIRLGTNPDQIELPCNMYALTYEHFTQNRERWMRPRDTAGIDDFIRNWP